MDILKWERSHRGSLSVKREKSSLKIQTCLNIFETGIQIYTICIVLETLEHMAEIGTNLLLKNIPSTQVSQDSHRIRSTDNELMERLQSTGGNKSQ